jgi:hypothetical protein
MLDSEARLPLGLFGTRRGPEMRWACASTIESNLPAPIRLILIRAAARC